MYNAEPDAKSRFGDSASEEFWIWLNGDGLKKYPELREMLATFPDKVLMNTVAGLEDEIEFGISGASIYRSLTTIVAEQGHSWKDYSRILDFACGCGRVTRLFLKHYRECEIFGSDINKQHIDWLRKNLPIGTFTQNRSVPPTGYQSSFFNLVYCISLFSHLSEERQLLWLKELARITLNGGLVILTVHGSHAYRVLTDRPDIRQRNGITEQQLSMVRSKMNAGAFAFITQDDSYIDADTYGFTFIPTEYIHRVWSSFFEIVCIKERVIDDWQDAIILRPKALQ